MLDLIILGIVQGLTEFLPISSTAHLLFAEHYLGLRRPGIALEAALHLGTVAAAVVLFWPDIVRLVRGGITLPRRPAQAWNGAEAAGGYPRLAASIVAATAVTAALGLAFAGPLERLFESVRGAAYQLLVAGTILLWSRERGTRTAPQATLADGVALGLAQAVSIIPGISRSGITIVTAVALGMRRTEAARLSFLIGIPAVLGASLFGLKDVNLAAQLGYTTLDLIVGFLVAAAVGAAAILWLIAVVRRGRLIVFTAYCWLVGILVLATTR
ncbi:MAG: undecaprenyl-diphosphate phosphatase [Armatimonadota bacterium]